MRSLASRGNSRAAELIQKTDELGKMINADLWARAAYASGQLP
jgi:hypothetical protein